MTNDSPIYLGLLKRTPLGGLWAAVSENGLVAVEWDDAKPDLDAYLTKRLKRPSVVDATRVSVPLRELDEYLRGRRKVFTFPIDWGLLRPFQRAVLQLVFAIPYGETRSYGEIARQAGRPRAARAVGRANATNPMPLVIPCHRVVGSDGKLHGYSGGEGLKTKEWLLKTEGAVMA
ncbi:MAG: methylated-DNA--[protein]-cysteine S-methyltransferase [Anaerolineales bacterium]|nr:MAG: methylated-DNA--[protein]-cysteine S-methyltransferase [Anaerolineales bacterium]